MKRSAPEDQAPRERETAMPKSNKGMPRLQEFRRLKRENPGLEAHEVWALFGYGPGERAIEAGQAPWADGRASPAEARFRNDPR